MFWSFGTRREFYQTHFVSDLFGCTGFWRSAFSVHKGRSLADLDVDEQVRFERNRFQHNSLAFFRATTSLFPSEVAFQLGARF